MRRQAADDAADQVLYLVLFAVVQQGGQGTFRQQADRRPGRIADDVEAAGVQGGKGTALAQLVGQQGGKPLLNLVQLAVSGVGGVFQREVGDRQGLAIGGLRPTVLAALGDIHIGDDGDTDLAALDLFVDHPHVADPAQGIEAQGVDLQHARRVPGGCH